MLELCVLGLEEMIDYFAGLVAEPVRVSLKGLPKRQEVDVELLCQVSEVALRKNKVAKCQTRLIKVTMACIVVMGTWALVLRLLI